MIYSNTEVFSLYKSAAKGAGFPTGLCEELAKAGLALDTAELNGARTVLQALQGGFHEDPQVSRVNNILSITAPCCAPFGLSCCELLQADPDLHAVKLLTVNCPRLLIGYGIISAQRLGCNYEINFSDTCTVNMLPEGYGISGKIPGQAKGVIITRAKPDIASSANITKYKIFYTLTMEQESFDGLKYYAAKTHVPESEASRLTGAGAGLNDND